MNYRITIKKTEANTNFVEEMKDYEQKQRENRMYGGGYDKVPPERNIVSDVLLCELTEEQYKKIKAEVFKTFE